MKYLYVTIAILLLVRCSETVTTSPIKKNVQEVIFASGVMEMEDEYMLSALGDGIVTSLEINPGDFIVEDQVLAILDYEVQQNQVQEAEITLKESRENSLRSSPQLQSLLSQIKQAEVQLNYDKNNYLVYKNLFAKGSISKSDFNNMELQYEASQSNLDVAKQNYLDLESSLSQNVLRNELKLSTQNSLLNDLLLKSTSTGQVLSVLKKQGELVRKGEPIAKIGQGDYLAKLFISEEDVADIELDQAVTVSLNTYTGRTFQAKVSKIHPSFDESEQSYLIEATFDELPDKVFSGTQLQANIQSAKKNDVLLIPTNYLRGDRVQLENGELRVVEIGFTGDEWTEIKSGINENDVIVE